MSVSIFRCAVCWAMIVISPVSLLASDAAPAILHSKGPVLVNSKEASDSTAILPGDLLETEAGEAVNLTTEGSTIVIQEKTIVKYNGDSLTLEHGSVSVGTSNSFSVDVDCLRVVPVKNEWTQYDVNHVDSHMNTSALKLDVNVVHGATARKTSPEKAATESATVHEGEKAAREVSDVCGVAAIPANVGNPVNTKLIGIGAGAGGGVLLICLLLCGGKNPPHMSQSNP
jgi:hypothetical protein